MDNDNIIERIKKANKLKSGKIILRYNDLFDFKDFLGFENVIKEKIKKEPLKPVFTIENDTDIANKIRNFYESCFSLEIIWKGFLGSYSIFSGLFWDDKNISIEISEIYKELLLNDFEFYKILQLEKTELLQDDNLKLIHCTLEDLGL